MRCLALAEAWRQNGGDTSFAAAELHPGVEARIEHEGFRVEHLPTSYPDSRDADAMCDAAARLGRGWMVVDGYAFDAAYHAALRRTAWPLMVIDDYAHLPYYDADVLLNQNLGAEHLTYSGPPAMRRLLGTQYVLMREEFAGRPSIERPTASAANRLLVTMGGGDPHNVTARVVKALIAGIGDRLAVTVVIGPSNPHADSLWRMAAACPAVELVEGVTAIRPIMESADLAVTAAGSTCWELAYLGIPMITVVTADNQRGIAGGLEDAGASINLGWHSGLAHGLIVETVAGLRSDVARRARMSATARRLVDGKGAARVTAALRAS